MQKRNHQIRNEMLNECEKEHISMNWNTSAKKRSSKAKQKNDEKRHSYRPDLSQSRGRRSTDVIDEENIATKWTKPNVSDPPQGNRRGDAVIRTASIYTKPLRNEFVPPNVSSDVFYLANKKPINRIDKVSTVSTSSNYDLSALLELTPTDDNLSYTDEQTVLFINDGKPVNYEPVRDVELLKPVRERREDVTVYSPDDVDFDSTDINAENWLSKYYTLENMLPIHLKDEIITKENELKCSLKTDILCARTRLNLLYVLCERYTPREERNQHQLLEIIRFLEQVDKVIVTQAPSEGTTSTAHPTEINDQKEWVLFESTIPAMLPNVSVCSTLRDSGSHSYSVEASPGAVVPQGGENVDDEMLNVKFFL